MALTKEQQAIQDSYNRAKAQYDANLALQKKQAAERLAMQTKQLGSLTAEAKGESIKNASKAYVSAQQGQRVLGSQLTNAGLGQSGYKSLAQMKMANELKQNQSAIGGQLQSTLSGYGRTQEANQLNYNQDIATLNNAYTQNIANLNLDKSQSLDGLTTSTGMNLNDTILAGNTGRLTYAQYKLALDDLKVDAATKSALLQNYLKYQAQRGVQ